MEKNMICPCGLTCCDCLFYKSEIYDDARKFRDTIKKYQLDKFLSILSKNTASESMRKHLDLTENEMREKAGVLFKSFEMMPEFIEMLENIIKLQCKSTCTEAAGCSLAGVTHKCGALKCIETKRYAGCWECNDFKNCEKLSFLKQSYGHVIEENLTIIKEKGHEEVKSRGDKYYAWQRK